MTTSETIDETERRDAFAERIVADVTSRMEAISMYLGVRLGLYEALANGGPATEEQLAARSGIAGRYAREWLEQQASAGVIEVDDPGRPEAERVYALPEPHREVLLEEDSPVYLAGLTRCLAGIAKVIPDLQEAYRSGGGVPYADFGPDIRQGIGTMNRTMFINDLAGWMAAVPDVHARLKSQPSARVADIACGIGWSTISLARAYPAATIVGLDLDEASIDEARRNAAEAGMQERVSFEVRDATSIAGKETFDVACIFEGLHDMAHPIEALRGFRKLLAPQGSMIIADERVARAARASRRPGRAANVRLQRAPLPAGDDGGVAIDRDGDLFAARHAAPIRAGGRFFRDNGPTDRERFLALLSAQTVSGIRGWSAPWSTRKTGRRWASSRVLLA